MIEDGRLLLSETGTGQGQGISPLLANIYLHYVLHEWFETVVKPRLKGEAYEVCLPMISFSASSIGRTPRKCSTC